MRLLRDLPGYSPLFDVGSPDQAIDCVLTPPAAAMRAVVIEAKLRPRSSEIQRIVAKVRRAATAWGKGTLAALIVARLEGPLLESNKGKGRAMFLLQFDVEGNTFRGEGAHDLVRTALAPS